MTDLKSMSGFSPQAFTPISRSPDATVLAGSKSGQTNKSSQPMSPIPADQFESMFYSMMIKQMRQSMSESGLFPGEQTDSYGSLFDMFMGQHLAEAQPLGIASMIARYEEAGVAQ